MKLKCVCVYLCLCVWEKEGWTEKSRMLKDKKSLCDTQGGKEEKESKIIEGWNWFPLNETFFVSHHNVSSFRSPSLFVCHGFLSNVGLSFSPLLICHFPVSRSSSYSKTAPRHPDQPPWSPENIIRSIATSELMEYERPVLVSCSHQAAFWNDPQGERDFLHLL